jgi:DNA-directed RNA polymerase subunit K/omega
MADVELEFEDYGEDAEFDEDYIDDPEQQTQDDLDLTEYHDDLDTDVLGDMTEFDKDIRQALTSSSASVLGRGVVPPLPESEGTRKSDNNPYDFPVFRTRNYLTKYEKTSLLGIRMEQLRRRAPAYVNLEVKDAQGKVVRVLKDEQEIATLELAQSVLPLLIDRPIPSNTTNRPTYQTVSLRTLIHSTTPNY